MQPSSNGSHEQPTPERREHPRYKRVVRAFISDEAASTEPRGAWVANCSQGGLRVLTHEEITPGTVLSLRPSASPPDFRWVKIEVRGCQPADDGENNWELSCQFVYTPSYSTLLLFR